MKHFPLLFLILVMIGCDAPQSQEIPPMSNSSFDPSVRSVSIFTTAKDSDLRLSATGSAAFAPAGQPRETEICVFVNPDKAFQELLGIGGAITDASAEVFAAMPADKQQELLKAYYDVESGIGYSLLRTTIHSSDFSKGSYTYVSDEDSALATFSIEHDRAFRIPMIKAATAAAGGELLLYASPWSPPAFMKDNQNMLQGGKLLPQFFDSWAQYYVKFIQEYEKEGMPIWGLTIQNEPMTRSDGSRASTPPSKSGIS